MHPVVRSLVVIGFALGGALNIVSPSVGGLLAATVLLLLIVLAGAVFPVVRNLAGRLVPVGVILVVLAIYIGAVWSQAYALLFGASQTVSVPASGVRVVAEVLSVKARYGKHGAQVGLRVLSSDNQAVGSGLQVKAFWAGEPNDLIAARVITASLDIRALPHPVIPGGYDWSRRLYFEGYGAVGFFTSRPRTVEQRSGVAGLVADIRTFLLERVEASVAPPQVGVARALLLGQRSQISLSQIEDYRAAGLSHVLAISGLHVGWVGVLIFVLVRRFISVAHRLVLYVPSHKIAAVCAAGVTLLYASVAEPSLATERATIMALAAYLAILFNRAVLSLHTLHLAMMAVVLTNPYAALTAGFQLSFAATWALVMVFSNPWVRQRLSDFRIAATNVGLATSGRDFYGGGVIAAPMVAPAGVIFTVLARVAGRLAVWFVLLLLVNLLVGVVVAPVAAYHFGFVHPYGVVGNILAAPVLLFVVMPALIVMAVSPLALAALAGDVVGFGLSNMAAIARWVASLPEASIPLSRSAAGTVIAAGSFGIVAFVVAGVMGISWLRRALVAAGAALVLALSLVWWQSLYSPLLLISERGDTLIYRDDHGAWHGVGRRDRRLADSWSARRGITLASHRAFDDRSLRFTPLAVQPDKGAATSRITCDDLGCAVWLRLPGNSPLRPQVAVDFSRGGIVDACMLARWVIVARALEHTQRLACGDAKVFDRHHRLGLGAAVLLQGGGDELRWRWAAHGTQRWR